MLYWHGEDREVLKLLRLSVLTGEHVNYSQILTKRSSLFTQFMITLLYEKLSTQIPLIFINISKTNYLLINHLILLLLLLKKVGSARLREFLVHPISPKTPAQQYQPIDRKKIKRKRAEDYSRDRAASAIKKHWPCS